MAEHSISYVRPFFQAESWPFGCEGELDVIPSELSVDFVVVNVRNMFLSSLSVPLFLASAARCVGSCHFSRIAGEGWFPPHPSHR